MRRALKILCTALLAIAVLVATSLNASQSLSGTQPDIAKLEIVIPAPITGTEPLYNYIQRVLTRALEVTSTDERRDFTITRDIPATQERQLRELDRSAINVTWSVLTQKREDSHLAVPFPLLGGLFNYRVLLVSESSSDIGPDTSIDDLRQYSAIQGYDWPDRRILEANGFKVKGGEYQLAFSLLRAGYVDYFPRAALEVGSELAMHDGVKVAQGIALYYPNNLVFFVNRSDRQLHERIHSGLNLLHQSGELQAILKQYSFIESTCSRISDKKILPLDVQPSKLVTMLQHHGFSLSCADIKDSVP